MSSEDTSSKDSTSSSSSSGSPSSSSSPSQEDVLSPTWLKAHTRKVNTLQSSIAPENVIELSDSSPVGKNVEDVASTYHAQNLGNVEEGEDDLHNLLASLGPDEAGPSRMGAKKDKSLEQYKQMLKDRGLLFNLDDGNV